MARPEPPTLAESIAAAHEWWREAGVDLAYHDEPRGWLAAEVTSARVPTAVAEKPVKARIGGDPRTWPADLAGFAKWWLEEPSLDTGPLRRRVAPRGSAHAKLMILVPMPEADDTDVLLSGVQGRLIANVTRAMGLAPEAVYLAAALPRHVSLPDWSALADDGLGAVLRHHVALAAPERLLVLGGDVLSLVRHDLAQGPPAVSELPIQSGSVPLMSSDAPGRVLDHTRSRIKLWRQWLEWTGTA